MGKNHCGGFKNYGCGGCGPYYYPINVAVNPLTQNLSANISHISVQNTTNTFTIINSSNTATLIINFINNSTSTATFIFNGVTTTLATLQSYNVIVNVNASTAYVYSLTGANLSYTIALQSNPASSISGTLTATTQSSTVSSTVINSTLTVTTDVNTIQLNVTSQEKQVATFTIAGHNYPLLPQVTQDIFISANKLYKYVWTGALDLPFTIQLNAVTESGLLPPTKNTSISSHISNNMLEIKATPVPAVNITLTLLSTESADTIFTFDNVDYTISPFTPYVIDVHKLRNSFSWPGTNKLLYSITASNAQFPAFGFFAAMSGSSTIISNTLVVANNLHNAQLTVSTQESTVTLFIFNAVSYALMPGTSLTINLAAGSYSYSWAGAKALLYTLNANNSAITSGSFAPNNVLNPITVSATSLTVNNTLTNAVLTVTPNESVIKSFIYNGQTYDLQANVSVNIPLNTLSANSVSTYSWQGNNTLAYSLSASNLTSPATGFFSVDSNSLTSKLTASTITVQTTIAANNVFMNLSSTVAIAFTFTINGLSYSLSVASPLSISLGTIATSATFVFTGLSGSTPIAVYFSADNVKSSNTLTVT